MHPKKLMLLAVIAFIVVGIAIQLTTEAPQTEKSTPNKLFPSLMDKLNDVDNIQITSGNETFTVQFESGKWGLVDKQGYPVKEENVRNVLLGMASLTIVEPKTKKPENYAQLGVQDANFKDADSALVTLNQADNTIASLIIGYDRVARTDSSLREIYVRKPNEQQSWAVEGLLNLEKQATDWLEKNIINVENSRMREVVIYENGQEMMRIFKQQPSESDYQLANLPENASISSSYSVNQIANFLSNLNMEDVTVSDSISSRDSRDIIFNTFDGLQVTLTVTKQNDVFYAKFAAAYVEPEPIEDSSQQDRLKPAVEVQQEVATLNQTLAQWVYILPRYKVNYLFKQPTDLYKFAEDEPDNTQDDAPFSIQDAFSNLSTGG